MNDNTNNQATDYETPLYSGHAESMECIEQMIDFTPDIDSEYALLMTRDLFRGAPDLLDAAKFAILELQKICDVHPSLSAVSKRLNAAIAAATPPRPLMA
ncbi:MAG: hypothetical protein IPK32_05990 [Verrucomicrobiaceae bacterium]|nr:hypothetical protein [Verrucomicrobiaceae bacterium]